MISCVKFPLLHCIARVPVNHAYVFVSDKYSSRFSLPTETIPRTLYVRYGILYHFITCFKYSSFSRYFVALEYVHPVHCRHTALLQLLTAIQCLLELFLHHKSLLNSRLGNRLHGGHVHTHRYTDTTITTSW